MKEKFTIEESQGIKMILSSTGFTPAAKFFIAMSLVFIAFLSYAFYSWSNFRFSDLDRVSAFVVLFLVMISSIVLFLIAYSLSNEIQEISIDHQKMVIKKNRPLWPGETRTVNLDQVDGFAMEKLGFTFMNVWYAFIFHKDFGAEEVENFLSPQVRFAGKSISFLEYADEKTKRKAVEKLKRDFGMNTL